MLSFLLSDAGKRGADDYATYVEDDGSKGHDTPDLDLGRERQLEGQFGQDERLAMDAKLQQYNQNTRPPSPSSMLTFASPISLPSDV